MSYKSEMVLEKIRAFQQRRREITSSPASLSLLERTSRGYKEIIDYDKHLLTTMKKNDMSNNFRLTLKRHIKGSTATIYSRELVKFDLNQTHVYQKTKNARNSLSDTVATKSGVITAGMIRAKKRKCDEDDVKKTKRAVEATEAKLKKKQIKRQKKLMKLWKEMFRELKKTITARNKRLGLKKRNYVIYTAINAI